MNKIRKKLLITVKRKVSRALEHGITDVCKNNTDIASKPASTAIKATALGGICAATAAAVAAVAANNTSQFISQILMKLWRHTPIQQISSNRTEIQLNYADKIR